MASADRNAQTRQAAAGAAVEATAWASAREAVFTERLAALVAVDSGPDAPEGREQAAAMLAGWAVASGCETEIVAYPSGGHLICRLQGNGAGRIVLLGHHDTVFAAGTAAERPMNVSDGVAHGPGVADMKGGLLVALAAMEALANGPRPFASVELHSVPDEEVRVVPFATMDRVRGSDAVLVLECGRENGDFVRGRKTGAWLRLAVEGRSAHAGTEPGLGRSAVIGLCHEVLRLSAVDGARPGLTVIAGTIAGGTIANVVPQHAETIIDVRAPTRSDFDWASAEIGRTGDYDGLTVSVENQGTWPGIEPTPASDLLLTTAVGLGRTCGLDIGGQISGGMSDGCWTAAEGVPTLDGLGPVGGLDHSPSEYMLLDSVPPRCGIVAGLCTAVGRGLLNPVTSQGGDD
jgi:glutamate carboxypeptidase